MEASVFDRKYIDNKGPGPRAADAAPEGNPRTKRWIMAAFAREKDHRTKIPPGDLLDAEKQGVVDLPPVVDIHDY